MDELRRASQALGLPVRSMEAEFGPSQCEFTFDPDGPMAHADAMMLFRLDGQADGGAPRSARYLHVPSQARQCGAERLAPAPVAGGCRRWPQPLFVPGDDGQLTPQASGWIAGLLEHAARELPADHADGEWLQAATSPSSWRQTGSSGAIKTTTRAR